MNDGVTSEVSLGGAAVREETENQAPSENRGLIVFLGVLGVMIVGLSVGIVLVNARKGGDDSDTVQPGSVTTENVVIKDKDSGWSVPVSASVQATVFSNDINYKLSDSSLGYSLEDAREDYQKAFSEASDDLKYELALPYARFMVERLGDLDAAIRILDEVREYAILTPERAGAYYALLYQLSSDTDDKARADYYMAKRVNVSQYYNDWSNYED